MIELVRVTDEETKDRLNAMAEKHKADLYNLKRWNRSQELSDLIELYDSGNGLGISDYTRLTKLLLKENEELRQLIKSQETP